MPLATPSMNSLLYCIKGQHSARSEVRMFRSQMKSYLPGVVAGTGPYSLSLHFYENWYVKSGYPKRKDVQNLVKCCVDAISERYGFDDSLLWNVSCEKVHSIEKVGIALTLKGYDDGGMAGCATTTETEATAFSAGT